jgi:hypothetical protein
VHERGKEMGYVPRILFAMISLVIVFPASALAFQCRGSIINTGDLTEIVVMKCGEPDGRRMIREELTGQYSGTARYQGRGRFTQEGSVSAASEPVEVFTYNCGDGRLIHLLTFKGGTLQKVDTAGFGVGPRRCD